MSDQAQSLTASIVSAFISNNSVAPHDLSGVIQSVYSALTNLGKEPVAEALETRQKPAVPIKKSVTTDTVTCLECGAKMKMLKRHLAVDHDTTPEAYRAKWGLPAEYPMVAPDYAKKRSDLARRVGLGTMKQRTRHAPAK